MSVISFKAEPKLGEGLFTVSDASKILELPSDLVRRWIKAYWQNRFLDNDAIQDSSYVWGERRAKAFNFYVLVEIIAVFSLRHIGVSFNKIRLAHTQLIKILGTEHPFASSKLMSDGGEIFWEPDETTLIQLDHSLQLSFKEIIAPFCKKLDFNDRTTLAQRYWPLGKDHSIVVDPHHCFGQPSIFGTNINVQSVLRLVKAGEAKHSITTMYDLNIPQVEDVISFERRLAA